MKRIYVVEDDPDVTDVLQEYLEFQGYETRLFASGTVALEAIANCMPDLVITDIMMAGMSGFELCRQIRLNKATKNIPMIAITGYDSADSRHKIFAAGIDDYLPKPFDLKVLVKKIGNLLTA